MQIRTSRFGSVEIEVDDILLFPNGLIGFEDVRHWVLLADAENAAVGWMQSVARAETALAVVSPRRFAPEYQVRVARSELAALDLRTTDRAFVLAIVGNDSDRMTLNLKAPLIINYDRRIGRQMVTTDEQPLRLELGKVPAALRRSA